MGNRPQLDQNKTPRNFEKKRFSSKSRTVINTWNNAGWCVFRITFMHYTCSIYNITSSKFEKLGFARRANHFAGALAGPACAVWGLKAGTKSDHRSTLSCSLFLASCRSVFEVCEAGDERVDRRSDGLRAERRVQLSASSFEPFVR